MKSESNATNRPSSIPRLDYIARARRLLVKALNANGKKVNENDFQYLSLPSYYSEDPRRTYFGFRDKMKRVVTIWFSKERDGNPHFEMKPAIADEDRQIEINAVI